MDPLTLDERKRFEAALLSAFVSAGDLAQVTLFGTGTALSDVVATGPRGQMVTDLVGWLDAQGKVADFLKEARSRNPGNPLLRAFAQSYAEARDPSLQRPPPLEPRLRGELLASLAAVPSLQQKTERDRVLSGAATAKDRNDLDARNDLELLVDQLPREALAKGAETAAAEVERFHRPLSERLRRVADALRGTFGGPVAAEPMRAKAPEPEALLFVGVDERKPRSFLQQAMDAGRSVARLAVPRIFAGVSTEKPAFGTGWLLAPTLMITNHHVIDARDRRREAPATPEDFRAQGGAVEVWFDYFEDGASVAKTKSAGLVAFDEALDFAVFRLSAVPDAAARRPLPVRAARPSLQKSTRLNIVQHAYGRPQSYALRNNFFAEAGGDFLRYLTDTEPGASGSPVFDDQWRVVGLHHASVDAPSKEVKTLDLASPQTIFFYNEGIFLDVVLAKLKALDPAAHAEVLAANGL